MFVVGFLLWADAQKSVGTSVNPRLQTIPLTPPEEIRSTPVSGLPSPRQQGASQKVLMEGHWHGMELIELTPALARQYRLEPGTRGLMVDEVTLNAAEAGLRAGDVVRGLNSISVANLIEFREATYALRDTREIEIAFLRSGRSLVAALRSDRGLGPAMFEAAPPILPGAIPPHQDEGRPCTDCHLIMTSGGQLAIDTGDLLRSPPPISLASQAPHGDRGPCESCHRIIRAASLRQ